MSDKVADVVAGKYAGARVIVIGEDKEVWNGRSWHEMGTNLAAKNYHWRMLEQDYSDIDPYEGKTYACDWHNKSILFHEKELDILRDATREDIRKNLEGADDDTDRIIINVKED